MKNIYSLNALHYNLPRYNILLCHAPYRTISSLSLTITGPTYNSILIDVVHTANMMTGTYLK